MSQNVPIGFSLKKLSCRWQLAQCFSERALVDVARFSCVIYFKYIRNRT